MWKISADIFMIMLMIPDMVRDKKKKLKGVCVCVGGVSLSCYLPQSLSQRLPTVIDL